MYTRDELFILLNMLYSTVYYKFYNLLADELQYVDHSWERYQYAMRGYEWRHMFTRPIDDMPLFINYKHPGAYISLESVIAQWRLKIGR